MAGYECALHDGIAPAVHLHTSLLTGATISICDEHLPAALIGALATELGIDAQGLYDNIKRYADKEQRKQEAAAAQAAEIPGEVTAPVAAGEPS